MTATNLQKFKCQQCNKEVELDTVFKFEVCPYCNGNLFPIDYVAPVDPEDEILRLSARIVELETSTYCAYCGEQYPLDDKAAHAVSEHIKTCKKHPMRKLEEEWDAKATKYRVGQEKADVKNVELREAINLLLDQVDYTAGACRSNEMVGAVLDAQIIKIARQKLQESLK